MTNSTLNNPIVPHSPAGTNFATPTIGPSRRKRWLWRFTIAIILLGALYLLRAPILRQGARVLIVDEAIPVADCIMFWPGNQSYARAAELCQRGAAKQVRLIEGHRSRLEEMGILPVSTTIARRELNALGVSPERVETVLGNSTNDWEFVEEINRWLRAQPSSTVTIVCNRFGSRRARYIIDHVLDSSNAQRVFITANPHEYFDEANWWKRKEGVLEFMNSSLSLVHAYCYGRDDVKHLSWDPDEYEENLRK